MAHNQLQLASSVRSAVIPEYEETAMGVKIRQKDRKWYMFINHQGRR